MLVRAGTGLGEEGRAEIAEMGEIVGRREDGTKKEVLVY